MAELLSEVLDYIKASKLIKVSAGSSTDNSIGLSISFNEDGSRVRDVKAAWINPSNNRSTISHYILQWRPYRGNFSYRQYRVVKFNSGGRYEVEIPETHHSKVYAVRVIVAYYNQGHIATNEKKLLSQVNSLRDAIKTYLIDVHSKDQPWLVDTWRYANTGLIIHPGTRNRVTKTSTGGDRSGDQYPDGRLIQGLAGSLRLAHYTPDDPENYIKTGSTERVIANELAHVYTLTNGITKNEAPIAIGRLYLNIISEEYATQRCILDEIYAALGTAAFLNVTPRAISRGGPVIGKTAALNSTRRPTTRSLHILPT